MKKIVIAAAVALLGLTACSSNDYNRCETSNNPMECNSWVDAGGDIDDYLVGGMVGYMLANRGGYNYVVRDPYYNGPSRKLHRQLYSQDRQISALKQKVARQKAELRRQQASPSTSPSKKSLFGSSSSKSKSYSSGYKPSRSSSRSSSRRK